jgi:DNA-binding XRE family transcriptional regulator
MIRLSPRLCKAARSLVGWQQDDLAAKSGVSKSTIGAYETKSEEARLTTMNNKALIEAFERNGILFIEENGEGPGVRLKKVLTHQELTKKIEAIDAHLEAEVPEKMASPKRGMQLLEHGHKTEVVKKLKQRRKKLEEK